MPRVTPSNDVARLRLAAARCIVALGTGVLQCPTNSRLRERLNDGNLPVQHFYRQLQLRLLQVVAWNLGERLRIVPVGSDEARQKYLAGYASDALTHTRPRGSGGLSRRLRRVLRGLWEGDSDIAVGSFGSPLFEPTQVEDLAEAESNDEQVSTLISIVRSEILGDPEPSGWPPTDIQVLGRIHEWLLELQLVVHQSDWTVELETVPGHERRSTGSYFTPPDLVEELLDLVLEPALDERTKGLASSEARSAILKLRVVDPACGTGIFLLAAARRIAARLESLSANRASSKRNSPATALSDIISQCLYGVDIGDTTVWLCRLLLWFECGPPYGPQPAIEQHILCGNSILGAWPGQLEQGIPDIAFAPAETDDVSSARALSKRNHSERGQSAAPMASLAAGDAGDKLADLWCAAFVWPKPRGALVPTQTTFAALQGKQKGLSKQWEAELRRLTRGHRFFHWHLRFPEIFGERPQANGTQGGFDLVIGNPPWVAHAGRSTQRLPLGVKHFNLHVYASFRGYPTTHGVFVEMATRILARGGRLGLIVPASVADLDGYAPTRESHDRECELIAPLPDYGEGRFAGVTQPCIALVSRRTCSGRAPAERGKPWQLNRQDLDDTGAALLARWERHRPFPPELFGERGFQSTPDLRKHFCKLPNPTGRFTLALREGADVREFQLGEPNLYADGSALGSILRPSSEFAQVTVVVRQTARYPIAAPSDGLAFRNSLLAVLAHRQWPWQLILCLLNSSLFRWCHYHRYRDGRQPILPQLKVGHLRSLAAPLVRDAPALSALEALGAELARRNSGIQGSERAALDANVSIVYGLTRDEHQMVTLWHADRPR